MSDSGPRGWGKRIEKAILLYSSANGRTSLGRIGELVASFEGREKPYAPPTVSEWISEKNEPTIAAFEAMAQVFDCDPWWIVWDVGRAPANPIAKEVKPLPRSQKKRRGGDR
jgi:hypothetical protein